MHLPKNVTTPRRDANLRRRLRSVHSELHVTAAMFPVSSSSTLTVSPYIQSMFAARRRVQGRWRGRGVNCGREWPPRQFSLLSASRYTHKASVARHRSALTSTNSRVTSVASVHRGRKINENFAHEPSETTQSRAGVLATHCLLCGRKLKKITMIIIKYGWRE